jgi:hypothetical protein
MKLIIAAVGVLLYATPDPSLLVLDKQLKKPIHATSEFTTTHYLQQFFPVYEAEVEALLQATDIAVKRMEKTVCYSVDTIATPHTTILVKTECDNVRKISVTVITRIEETNTAFGYNLVEKEENKRKAQQKLLHFATYLDQ